MLQKCIYHIVDAITAFFVKIALADIAFFMYGVWLDKQKSTAPLLKHGYHPKTDFSDCLPHSFGDSYYVHSTIAPHKACGFRMFLRSKPKNCLIIFIFYGIL